MKRMNAGDAVSLNTEMATPSPNSVLKWEKWMNRVVKSAKGLFFSLLPPLFLWCLIFLWNLRIFSLKKEIKTPLKMKSPNPQHCLSMNMFKQKHTCWLSSCCCSCSCSAASNVAALILKSLEVLSFMYCIRLTCLKTFRDVPSFFKGFGNTLLYMLCI